MSDLEVRFLGTGDAFGNGGRFQSCVLLRQSEVSVLIDCGATSLTAMRHQEIEPSSIDAVVLTHLHGDHFGGLPFLLLDGQFAAPRRSPLVLAGPEGTAERLRQAQEVFFPGSSEITLSYELELLTLREEEETVVGPARIVPLPVSHPSGAPSYALRIEWDGRVVAFSGDTEWTDSLISVAEDADLFVCECYRYEKKVPYHLDYATLVRHRQQLTCRRLVLTHLHRDMLERRDLELETATDGLTIRL